MAMTTVWTKQGRGIEAELRATGRYIARREWIEKTLGNDAPFFLPAYDWLQTAAAKRLPPPDGAGYPIWVSLQPDSTMLPSPEAIILEIQIDAAALLPLDIARWSRILDGAYLPADEADLAAHREQLARWGCDDARACITPFYPEVKREILASWQRLFDSPGDGRVGIIWEIREEQIRRIVR